MKSAIVPWGFIKQCKLNNMDRKLNEDDGYLESVRLWIEAQQFLIDELNLKKDYIVKNIDILTNSLNNTNEAIIHEEEQLLSYKNQHNV